MTRLRQHFDLPRALAVCLCCLGLLATGCIGELNTEYGRMSPSYTRASVNGVDVFARLFEVAGREVLSRGTLLTFDFQSVDTIVWFPDDYGAPNEMACQWLERWLAEKPNRTLIYVGRDFDAAPLYWAKMLPVVAGEQAAEYLVRQQNAGVVAKRRPSTFAEVESLECPWFTVKSDPISKVKTLGGPWSQGISPAGAEIQLRDRLQSDDLTDSLLTDGKEAIVWRLQPETGEGQIIVVENGSFLLNLPLVNHEHRKLAGRLIDETGPGKKVVFLHSGEGGPAIDPRDSGLSLWRFFAVWPLNIILLQIALIGVIFCYARWPIFGRPRQLPPEPVADFGKHVDAVGRLLRASRDRAFVQAKLEPVGEHPPVKKITEKPA